MAGSKKFEKLMEPGYIGRLRTKNRIIKTAAGTGYAENGNPSKRMADFYAAFAKGGVGLVILENCGVEWPRGTHFIKTGLRFHDDHCIPYHSRLTEAVHRYDCPIFIQFMHAGPWLAKQEGIGFQERVAASTVGADELPSDAWIPGKELTIPEIHELIDVFAKAAERAKKAGYDGVEINGSYYHLINGFLSRFWNRRRDEYGCDSLENRARFYCDIIKEVKRRCGGDYPVATNINAVEYGLKNGITLEEAKRFAPLLEAAGADLIQVRVTGYGEYFSLLLPEHILYPEPPKNLDLGAMDISRNGRGILVPFAAAIKQGVKVPVACAGRLDAEIGEEILRQGELDFVGMTRGLIADPELPNKVAAGRLEDIVPCPGCGYCSHSRKGDSPLRCRMNASAGREEEYEIKPAEKKKKVLIAGGGPAGLEAARVAALRGHEVTLYEKGHALGGLMPLAALVKDFELLQLLSAIRYFETQMARLGVALSLGKEVDRSAMEKVNPDVVILATGGVSAIPKIPGIENRKVIDSARLHNLLKTALKFFGPKTLRQLTKIWMPIGKRVVIIGGAIQGCQLAAFLVKRGRKVTIVDTAETLGEGLPYENPVRLFKWLKEKGATTLAGVKYERITDEGLVVVTKEGERKILETDSIIITLPALPDAGLLSSLKNKVAEIYQIGDCREFGLMHDAIADGSRVGRNI
jgi:2,4-dienoyl-CoA reductase (NADPH2)